MIRGTLPQSSWTQMGEFEEGLVPALVAIPEDAAIELAVEPSAPVLEDQDRVFSSCFEGRSHWLKDLIGGSDF